MKSRYVILAIVLAAVALVVVAAVVAGSHRTSVGFGSMRIAKLRAKVVEMGKLSSWDYHDTAYGVRVRATVCFDDSLDEAVYPLEFRIAHFGLFESTARSWGKPFRTVTDDAHWIVPFGETATRKDGRSCTEVVLEDILPDQDYKGVESELGLLIEHPPGFPSYCYGVSLRITAATEANPSAKTHASRRVIVQCGSFGPL